MQSNPTGLASQSHAAKNLTNKAKAKLFGNNKYV
jgi:hypothetical protein